MGWRSLIFALALCACDDGGPATEPAADAGAGDVLAADGAVGALDLGPDAEDPALDGASPDGSPPDVAAPDAAGPAPDGATDPDPDAGDPDHDAADPDAGPEPDAAPEPDATPAPDPDAAPEEPDRSDEAFQLDHILQVEVELDPDDWAALRSQGRSFSTVFQPGCLDQPFESPFTWFNATVTVDGERFPNVGVRKKGFLGSLSEERPSIKVHFEKFDEVDRFRGLERMTFNNNRQDASQMRQCLAYGYFTELGVPAPRCSFAQVTVNGQDMGIYTHVESMKKAFLRRHFADDEGDFFEGQFSDFRDGWNATFQKKTNDDEPPGDTVARLSELLAGPDEGLQEALEARVDMPRFMAFWAGEVVTGHWDGYSGNINNYYFYVDPDSGRAVFMPWGTDGAFSQGFGGRGGAASLRASGVLNRRLYLVPGGSERYVAALRAALEVYDEDALNARIDRMREILEPAVRGGPQAQGFDQAIGGLRQFINAQRGRIEGELQGGPPALREQLRQPFCREQIGDVTFEFDTIWDSHPEGMPGDGSVGGTLNGQPLGSDAVETRAGAVAFGENAGDALVYGTYQQGNQTMTVRVEINPINLSPGEYRIDDVQVSVDVQQGGGFRPQTVGLAFDGLLVLEEISTEPGGAVRGQLAGGLMRPR